MKNSLRQKMQGRWLFIKAREQLSAVKNALPGLRWARAEGVRIRPAFSGVRRSDRGHRFRPGPRPRDASTFSFNWTSGAPRSTRKTSKSKLL